MSPEGAALARHIREHDGFCNDKLDLCGRLPCDDIELSVVALQDIPKGELLLRVPVETCMNGRGDVVARDLAQQLKGDLDPYLATLPADPPGLECWTPAERLLLRGTRLENVLVGKADRAALLVRTRCVHIGDGVALVPGIDALNDASGRAALCTTLQVGTSFEMVAERDIARGEEVTHAYDDVVDSADYLERYGFAPVVRTCSKIFTVEDILHAAGTDRRDVCATVLAASQGRVAVTPAEPLPDDLVCAVLVCILQDEEELAELLECVIEEQDPVRDPTSWANVDAAGLVAQASEAEQGLVAACLATLADHALGQYHAEGAEGGSWENRGDAWVAPLAGRVEAARRVRDAERSACVALRAALKDLSWLEVGEESPSRKRGRSEEGAA